MTDTSTYTMPDPMDFGNFFVISMLAKCFEEDEARATAAVEGTKAFLNRLKPVELKTLNAIGEKSMESLNRQYEDLKKLEKEYEKIENEEKRKEKIEEAKSLVCAEMEKIFNSMWHDVFDQLKFLSNSTMASIAIMAGGAILNAAAFIGGNYLARALGGGDDAALKEKERHDKALEAYQAAYAKYSRDRTKLLDWIQTNAEIKEQAKQNFTNTDYAFKLYNQAHPDKQMIPPKEPKFSDFYQPSEQQKQGELMFVGAGALALGYAAFRFL
ncbi:hypothetical protein ACROYT_G005466 [Oculina patagonica]